MEFLPDQSFGPDEPQDGGPDRVGDTHHTQPQTPLESEPRLDLAAAGGAESDAAAAGAESYAGAEPEPESGPELEPVVEPGLPPDSEPEAGPQPEPGFEGFSPDPESDSVPVEVPEALGVLPPGALLCEILDDLPVDQVSGHDSVVVMAAAYRQLCRQQAVFYESLVETGLRAPGSASQVARLSAPGEFASEEARAKLMWSRQRSQREYVLGFALFMQFPALGAALKVGRIDLPRARAFVDWTDGLTDAQAATVIDHLLPDAASVVVGELIDQIKLACLAVDPEWAEKTYKNAVKTRRVRGYRNPDGTANLGGYAQPVDRVVAACGRIDQLARACKQAGDKRAMDLIRSDLYLRMLDGTFEAMTDAEIIAHVVAHPLDDHTGTPDPHDPDSDENPDDGTGDGSGDDTPENGPGGDGPGPIPDFGSPGGPAEQSHSPGSDDPGTDPPGPDRQGSGGGSASDARPGQRPAATGCAVPELRVQLTTLLGREHPAQLPGWDFVPGWLARRLTDTMDRGEWRWVVCDAEGRAVDGGLTQARPSVGSSGRVGRHRRGGIVELAITRSDLKRLAAEPAGHGPWASVIIDIARQHSRAQPGPCDRSPGGRSLTGPMADLANMEAGRRVPGARLRRWIQLRDRKCTHPCCRAPAATTDVDHRVGWAAGGPTVPENLGPACRHDHRIKDEAGWQVHGPTPGVSVWTSPLGHSTTARTPLVIPTPVPLRARDDGWVPYSYRWPGDCGCLIRPCRHYQPEPGIVGADASADDGAAAGTWPAGPSQTPLTDRLRRERNVAEPFYDDAPPPF